MKKPFGKRGNPHLIYEKYKNCVFYHVSNHKGEQAIIEPCILRIRDNSRLKYVTLSKLNQKNSYINILMGGF